MNKSYNNATPKIVAVIAALAVIAVGSYVAQGAQKEDNLVVSTVTTSSVKPLNTSSTDSQTIPPTTATTTPTAQGTDSTNVAPVTVINDGEYTATASYAVPGGDINSLTIIIGVKDGVIISAKSTSQYAERESARYISGFEANLSGAVVGKDIDGISLTKIGGASLTTQSFNKAINTIINDASS